MGGNWFAPIRVEVPTAAGTPDRSSEWSRERLARARSEPALRLTSTLALAIGRLPTRVLIPALHAQADTVDFAATTLPGARGPRHICGATVEQSYPVRAPARLPVEHQRLRQRGSARCRASRSTPPPSRILKSLSTV